MFQKAVKHESKLRLAIAGPSGSGKTYTALALGTELGKTAVVDTEHGSASKYADLFDFDVVNFDPPFHPDRFIEAINAAAQAGYSVVILDSLSHAWAGTGGVLEIVDQAQKRFGGNKYYAWAEGTPVQNRLIEAIVGAQVHIIATMRSKEEYAEVNENGRKSYRKVGTAPIQRDGVPYEFDVMMDMDIDNNGIITKTRCSALHNAVIAKPGADLAETLRDWLSGDERPDPLVEMMGADNVTAWSSAAYRLPYVRNAFENSQRLADWREYLTNGNGYKVEDNGKLAQILKDYCGRVADGVLVKEAAQLALDEFKPLFDEEE